MNEEVIVKPIEVETKIKPTRNSAVEMAKIIGILLILLNHVVNALCYSNLEVDTNYILDLSLPITGVTNMIILIITYFGCLGNLLFFTASAYYLSNRETCNYKKVLRMILDVWVISILWLIVALIYTRGDISIKLVAHLILPTMFANNWYMTAYIVFCLVVPLINLAFNKLNGKQMIPIVLLAFLILIVSWIFWKSNTVIYKNLLAFFCYYTIIYFIKNYRSDLQNNVKLNIILCIASVVIVLAGLLSSNFVYNLIGIDLNDRWNSNSNIFTFIVAYSILNFCLKSKWHSRFANYLSSLSIYIYIYCITICGSHNI